MEKISLPVQVKISSQVLFQEIANEFVLLNMETEKYFGLDEVGARFWETLKEDENAENSIAVLLSEYNVEEETLRTDLLELLGNLKRERLVTY